MFTLRQVTAAGFFGVYSGCVPLTVDLARLPYWRGAWIGVLYGALNHFLVMWLIVLAVSYVSAWLGDFRLKQVETWLALVLFVLMLQGLSAMGCRLMGRYFHAPRRGGDAFDRDALLAALKPRDTGKRSVLHDVVTQLERTDAPPDCRYSWAWIALVSALSVGSMAYWIIMLREACLEAVYYGIEMDGAWYTSLMLTMTVPLVVLIVAHAACLVWLCRDVERGR